VRAFLLLVEQDLSHSIGGSVTKVQKEYPGEDLKIHCPLVSGGFESERLSMILIRIIESREEVVGRGPGLDDHRQESIDSLFQLQIDPGMVGEKPFFGKLLVD